MTTIDYETLRQKVDATLNNMIERFYKEVPSATHQLEDKEIQMDYYLRHSIETILRIRHKRMVDALVIHHFTKTDLRAAKQWAEYTEDEMLHGNMFAKDLERLANMSLDDIYQHEPLFATQLLNGYFYFTLEHEGPMASIASAYFLEYTTRMTQPAWLDNLEKALGKDMVKGARAHVDHDIRDNHSVFVWKVLCSLMKTEEDVQRFFTHLERIYALFAAYFTELHQSVQKSVETKIASNAAVSAINHTHDNHA